ncbi:MAG: putative DNA binding domain-containing protein [Prevotella sp.]|nr:putative DNA binding domain-containing protein [Prevotella sp.]
MKQYLLSLISEGEHQQQDFKYRVEDAVKLARSVSAFANTDGGRLLIGVRDDGYLAGVRSEEEIYMMHQAAYRYCRPEASIKFDTYHVSNPPPPPGHQPAGKPGMRTIVVASVPRALHRPVCALDEEGHRKAYIRIKDENIVASPVHIKMWRDEQATRGRAFTFGDAEHKLIEALNLVQGQMQGQNASQGKTLNQLVKHSRLPRHTVVTLLARLIRYGLASWQLRNHQFIFLPTT